MALLCVLLRGTLERLVGSDDYARRLLDFFDRRQSPDVRLLFSRGVTVGSVARLEGSDERRKAPAAVIEKQDAPTIQEHGLMPGGKGHLTSIANPLGEIDEGHQARDCTHLVIFYLISGSRGSLHTCSSNVLSSLLPAPLTWRACSPACVTRIGPKRVSQAADLVVETQGRLLGRAADRGLTVAAAHLAAPPSCSDPARPRFPSCAYRSRRIEGRASDGGR
jgi:hypothetical protein